MNMIWHKIWYDLWHNKLRTLLVVVSIAVGVFAVGTTFGISDQMIPVMDAAHQATMPSHVTMLLDQPVDRETLRALKKVPGVVGIDTLNEIEVKYKLNPGDKWHKGNILMRDDYEHQEFDILQLKAGDWPKGLVLSIERMHGPYYGIDIGDQVILQVDEQERAFPITGKIRHPFVPPPSMYDLTWFFGDEEVMEFFDIPRNKFTQFKFQVSPYSPEYAKVVASEVKERLGNQHINVFATMYQDPAKHWGRGFLDGMTLVLNVLAVLSMLLSVVLVMNTLTAIITQQTNQIGIMKAIGGSSLTISQVYLVGVLVYGLLALGIALPLGASASYQVSRSFLGLYNIDYENFALSNRAILFQVLAALVVPLFAALIPVISGSTITVRQAIASYGLGGDFGSNWLDRAIDRFGQRFLISYHAIALTNTFRRKGRLLLTQLVLVTAGIMFLIVMSLSSSIKATLDAEFGRRSHDLIINFSNMQRVDRMRALVQTVSGVEKADMWLIAPVTILHQGQKALAAGLGSQLQGVPLDDPMYKPLIVEGRWLQPGDDRVVVMNKQTADDENIHVGDTITLDMGGWGDDDWEVIGLYRVFLMFGGGYSVDAIYGPRQAVFEATKKTGKASTLLVRTQGHSADEVHQVQGQLEDLFERRHIEIDQTEDMPSLRKTSDTSFGIVVNMLLVLAIIVAVVGGIGLMGSLWISVIERTKEIGILRAIGAISSRILSMFILESVIQGLMSWVIAIPLSMAFAPVMANAMGQVMFKSGLDYQFNYQAALVWLAIILLLAILAAIIPARNAAQINVRQSLNYE
jgi:putative ABC transport system permease protein